MADLSFDDLIPAPKSKATRGERNNNPGNIEDGDFARSLPGYAGSDGRFAKFESMDHGYGAIESLLGAYGRKGINTAAGVINRWAPKEDGNPVNQYSAFVGEGDPNAPLDLADATTRKRVAEKIAHFENGKAIPRTNKSDGMVEPGNIDLTKRPVVKNSDGTISTVRSLGVNIDGNEILIPTVSDDGRIMSNDEAVQTFKRTGKHLGKFSSPEASSAYAEKLHNDQAEMYGKKGGDLSFDDLIPKQEGDTFADRFKGDQSNPGLKQQEQSILPAAIRDIPTEIANEAKAGLEPITALGRRSEMGTVEGLLSLPNAVGGALRIAASPVTGALKSALGHPIAAAETAVGGLINPEVARQREASGAAYEDAKKSVETALAAGRPAKMGAPVPAPALTEGQEVALAGQRQGIDLPRAVTSDSKSVQQVGKIAANVPVAGQPLRKASQGAMEQMGQAMDTARAGFGSSDAAAAGQAVREGVTQAIKSGPIKQKVDALYSNVDNLVNPTVTAPMPNTRTLASQIEGRRANAALPGSRNVSELDEALSRPGMNYEGIKDLRTYFGEMLDGSKEIPQGMSHGEVKQIYGALSKDMRLVIARAGGPDGLKAYDAAEKAAKRWADVRQDLQRVLNVNSEEGIFSKMVQAAGSKSSADLKLLGRVRGAVGPDKWNEVSSAVVERLGRAPDGTFSPDRLLGPSGLGGLSPEGKRLLFRSTGQSSHADTIDDIATISKRFKQLNQYANPSGTGQTTLGGAFGAGLVADPVSAVTTFLGAGGLSLVLSRPASARAMAAWARSYQRAATAQTAANVQGYQQASKLFATAVANNIGKQIGTVDVGSLTRQLQGAMPAGAQDEQN